MSTPVINVSGLSKNFGETKALTAVDLEVQQGHIHGFLGPNGAGKSTLIRVLLGILRASAGQATIFGLDVWSDAVRLHERLAYVPGDVALWPNLTGGETIDMLLRLRGSKSRRRKEELIELFELDPRKRVRTYSKGNRQKVALIAALAAEVDLLLLDEPTVGLDPLMEIRFQNVLREAQQRGQTVLLSSHILSQVEALSDSLSIIRQGHIVETGTLQELRHIGGTRYRLNTTESHQAFQYPWIQDLRVEGAAITFRIQDEHTQDVLHLLSTLNINSVTAQPPTLEELLINHYGEQP